MGATKLLSTGAKKKVLKNKKKLKTFKKMKCQANSHEIFKKVFKQNLVKEKKLRLKPNGVLRLYVNTHEDVNTHVKLCL